METTIELLHFDHGQWIFLWIRSLVNVDYFLIKSVSPLSNPWHTHITTGMTRRHHRRFIPILQPRSDRLHTSGLLRPKAEPWISPIHFSNHPPLILIRKIHFISSSDISESICPEGYSWFGYSFIYSGLFKLPFPPSLPHPPCLCFLFLHGWLWPGWRTEEREPLFDLWDISIGFCFAPKLAWDNTSNNQYPSII